MNVSFDELLKETTRMNTERIEWHHHYLPPNCHLNSTPKHLLILEGDGRSWQAIFDEKPMDELEQLENLFFNRDN